jgi:GTPase SAR1 family protein
MPVVPVGPRDLQIAVQYMKPGIAWLRLALRGKKIIVVGPSGAGKSTFTDYMHDEIFDPEQNPDVTIEPRTAKNFRFALGRNGRFASVKRAVDMPGQPDPRWVAQETYRQRPHALVIMLDATAPVDDENDPRSSAVWLRKFSRAAEQAARGLKGKRNRLQIVVVALNKADKASEQEFREQEDKCKEVLEGWQGSGPGARDPRILRCISVYVPNRTDHDVWISAVLSDIAIGLREG